MTCLNNGLDLQSIMAIDALHILLNVGNFLVKKCYEPFVDQDAEAAFLEQTEKKLKERLAA